MPNSSFDSAHTVIGKWHTSAKREYLIFFSDSEQLSFVASSNGSNATTVSSPALTGLATWNHFAVTYDAGAVIIYRNGVSIATGTSESSMYNSAEPLFLGGNEGGTSNDFYGELACVRLYNNVLTADEVKDESSGASVPYKYKGASTASLVTGTDSTMDGSNNWAAGGGLGSITANYSADSRNVLRLVTDDGGANDRGVLAVTAVKGARYRIQYDYKAVQGNKGRVTWAGYDSGNQQLTSTSFATVTSEFTATSSGSIEVTIYPSRADGPTGGSANDELLIDNFTLVRIGAVAEYDGSSAGEKVWGDKSGNDLHGTVNGATLENAPYDAGTEYEEGTFTPAWVAGTGSFSGTITYQNRVGKYVKIGNAVHITISFYNNAFESTGGSGSIKLGGLPYTASAKCALALGDTRLFNDDNPSEAEVGNGTTNVILYIRDGNADVANSELQVADLATGSSIVANLVTLSGTYFT
jgi:hypothetical protein